MRTWPRPSQVPQVSILPSAEPLPLHGWHSAREGISIRFSMPATAS